MSINAVGGDVSWSRFLALSEAARVRNTGFKAPVQRSGKAGGRVAKEYARTQPAAHARRNHPAPEVEPSKTRILGAQFDAYA